MKAFRYLLYALCVFSCSKVDSGDESIPVTPEESEIVRVQEISMNMESVSLHVGQTFKLHANILPEEAPDHEVFWKSGNKEVVSVDESGNIKVLELGTALITATSAANEKVIGRCLVSVIDYNIPLTGVHFIDNTEYTTRLTMNEGTTRSFVANPIPANSTVKNYKFETSIGGILTIIKQDGSNQCTVRANEAFRVGMPVIVVAEDMDGNVYRDAIIITVVSE